MPKTSSRFVNASSETQPFITLKSEILPEAGALRAAITGAYRRDEREAVQWLQSQNQFTPWTKAQTDILARHLVELVRVKRTRASGVDALMHEFSLSSEEGVALMCLAEALLRIPDHQTADRLIADKISKGDWRRHLGESPSLFVNAATWGLLITGKLVGTTSEHSLGSSITKLIAKGGEPLIRKGVDLAMRLLGNQFVTGQTIAEALENSKTNEAQGYRYSYDMLGEAALTEPDAARYYASYEKAIHAIGHASAGRGIKNGSGISVKLSALHPRYSRAQRVRVMQELLPRLKQLLLLAKHYDIGLNIDAEEADRLELSLDMLEALAFDADLNGFDGIGFVVQAYQKRCPFVIDYIVDLAQRSGRKLMVRLVKGAYWDTEIKRAQVDGLPSYPVYTRKSYTDISYLVCAQKLLAATAFVYPQFATHNAHTLASVFTWAQQNNITDYEFQCLHGMGETLYDHVVPKEALNKQCRIYAPVGSHQTLLAYLVRRLLENGANSSFVNQVVDEKVTIDRLIADPFDLSREFDAKPHPAIPLPLDLYVSKRKNSAGMDVSNEDELRLLNTSLQQFGIGQWSAYPLIDGAASAEQSLLITNPADRRDNVGQVVDANETDIDTALTAAINHSKDWQALAPSERAAMLVKAAELIEKNRCELMSLAVREAGKTLPNAVAEVREAVDFLRYYADQVANASHHSSWGPIVCISPWNFPLAIFIGQVSAALAVGNVVLAKPAEQTPLIAFRAVELMHQAGIPKGVLQLLPGRGDVVGARLVADSRVRGVIFTGSTDVAQVIHRVLAIRANQESCEIPLIAETGGQNAMIVDSSALPEQVVHDVIASAFDSAGQRCSALRVLFLQAEIADKTLGMLRGAMQELCVGNPNHLSTDIGPVIDSDARSKLLGHIARLEAIGKRCFRLSLSDAHRYGTFVAPTILEIDSLAELTHEVFGPVLHVIRYARDDFSKVINDINDTGYGLTLGIHSRIDETIDFICAHAHVGNIYVNRNMVGAVVGVQPFGGEGKSGTGPKAGGPLYLKRLQRHPANELDSYTMSQHTTRKVNTLLLDELIAWTSLHGYEIISGLGEQYRQATLIGKTLFLEGPTGERNTLSFAPRGIALCAASQFEALLNQLMAVFATNNIAAIDMMAPHLLPHDFPDSIGNKIQWIDTPDIDGPNIVLADTNHVAASRLLMVKRNDAIVQVVETQAEIAIPLWRLVLERAICVNTTAAGGNANLMVCTGS